MRVSRTLLCTVSSLCIVVACGDSSGTGGSAQGGGSVGGGTVVETCGNGVIDDTEACDGEDLNGETCISRGYPLGGTLACRASDCSFDFSSCVFAECGNGTIEVDEQCEGTDVGEETCETQGFNGGDLACTGSCTFDTTDCFGDFCGDGNLTEPEACDDGNTDSNDGCSSTCVIECGDGVCGPNETPCGCDVDCHDPGSCHPCECGNPVLDGGCGCDSDCFMNGNCCPDFAAVCSTVVIATSSTPTSIPDGAYDGTPATMACVVLPVNVTGHVITVDSVEIAMSIDWVGDLTLKLHSPADTFITLTSVPGFAEAADDGAAAGYGDNSDLVADAPIKFTAGAATSAELLGSTIDNVSNICADDMICEYAPDPGAAAAGNFATLSGQPSQGNWELCAGDNADGYAGNIQTVTLTMTVAPF